MIVPRKDILNKNSQRKPNKASTTIQIIIITLEKFKMGTFDTTNVLTLLSMICHNIHVTSRHPVNWQMTSLFLIAA